MVHPGFHLHFPPSSLVLVEAYKEVTDANDNGEPHANHIDTINHPFAIIR
jgi:hypothetical protein